MVSTSSVWGADEVLSGSLLLTGAQSIQGLQCLGSTGVANPFPGPCADVNNVYRDIWDDCSPRLLRCRESTQCPRPCFACVVCVCLSFLISPLPSQTYKPSHSATASELWDWWDAMEERTWKSCLKMVHFIDYNWSCIDGSVSCNPWKCYMDSMRECRAITSKKGKKNVWKEYHVLSGVCLIATLACCARALNNDGTASFAWIISIFPPK